MKFDFEYECDREWDEMKGGDRRRFCDSCDKHVHHISGMTKEQALAFLDEHDWNVCVDFHRDDNGHTVFREKERKLRMQSDGLKQLLASAAAVIPLALAGAFIDFDTESGQQPAYTASVSPEDPIVMKGSSPVLDSTASPIIARPEAHPGPTPGEAHPVEKPASPIVAPPEPPNPNAAPSQVEVEPFVAEVEEEEVVEEPEVVIPPPRPHVRGRIARPTNWDRLGDETDEVKLPVDDFILD